MEGLLLTISLTEPGRVSTHAKKLKLLLPGVSELMLWVSAYIAMLELSELILWVFALTFWVSEFISFWVGCPNFCVGCLNSYFGW